MLRRLLLLCNKRVGEGGRKRGGRGRGRERERGGREEEREGRREGERREGGGGRVRPGKFSFTVMFSTFTPLKLITFGFR